MNRLRATATLAVKAVPHVRMFVFGSFVYGESWPGDVDILVIYEHSSDTKRIRELIAPLYNELPIHVLYLTNLEELQLQFIRNEKCIPLA